MFSLDNHKAFYTCLLIPAMLWLFFNSATNWHYHQLTTGEVVKHSHPYKSTNTGDKPATPYQSHEHTALEYIHLDQFSKTGGLESTSGELSWCPTPGAEQLLSFTILPRAVKQPLPKNILRGPPAIS